MHQEDGGEGVCAAGDPHDKLLPPEGGDVEGEGRHDGQVDEPHERGRAKVQEELQDAFIVCQLPSTG